MIFKKLACFAQGHFGRAVNALTTSHRTLSECFALRTFRNQEPDFQSARYRVSYRGHIRNYRETSLAAFKHGERFCIAEIITNGQTGSDVAPERDIRFRKKDDGGLKTYSETKARIEIHDYEKEKNRECLASKRAKAATVCKRFGKTLDI